MQGIKNLICCYFFSFKKSASVLHGRQRKRNGVMAEIQSTFVIFMLCSTGLAQTQKTTTHKDIPKKIVVVNISNYEKKVNTRKNGGSSERNDQKKGFHSVRHPRAQKPLKLISYIKCIGCFVPKLFKQCKQGKQCRQFKMVLAPVCFLGGKHSLGRASPFPSASTCKFYLLSRGEKTTDSSCHTQNPTQTPTNTG